MKKMSPLKSIRHKCLECSSGSPSQVKKCVSLECSLWEFRLGKNPHIKGNISNLKPFPRKKRGFLTGVLAKTGIVEGDAKAV